MGKNLDVVAEFPGLLVIYQKIPEHEVGRHRHEEHEFFMPLQGKISVQHEDREVKAGPGRMLYVPPKVDHSFASSAQGSGERVIWLIQNSLWRKHVEDKFPPLAMAANSLAKELLFYLLIHPTAAGVKHFISALIDSLADSLGGAVSKEKHLATLHMAGRVRDPRVKKAIELIEASLHSCRLPETDIALEVGYNSLSKFIAAFKRTEGVLPSDFRAQK